MTLRSTPGPAHVTTAPPDRLVTVPPTRGPTPAKLGKPGPVARPAATISPQSVAYLERAVRRYAGTMQRAAVLLEAGLRETEREK